MPDCVACRVTVLPPPLDSLALTINLGAGDKVTRIERDLLLSASCSETSAKRSCMMREVNIRKS